MEENTVAARDFLASYQGKALRIMEVCGTHTHEIFRLGIRQLLPPDITLISGPGCPVCVTPVGYIDEAIFLALQRSAIITTFGDLLRVPGSEESLASIRKMGACVRMVYSPLDALSLAEKMPDREIVFLSVGFETTVPGECLAVTTAREKKIKNFSLLTSNKTMPRAYEALAGSCDAFLYPGHVLAITGTATCEDLAKRGVSGVVAGFSASELITALTAIVVKSASGMPFFMNCYPRVVRPEGNPEAREILAKVMESCDAEWRGLGTIPGSGLRLREEFSEFDARRRFNIPQMQGKNPPGCRCGDVLKGHILPNDCKLFGTACTPAHPVGACMVSHEGTCSAYYQYGEEK